ncbi:DUF3606 domain-containing protein [Mucilaginibacter flavus]|uniref:DUF3606 domain-containing protein n=1 Tax=Mucilaginibacter flavus TaxID=931504 RepID=UPI0025B3DC6C|nr:DUF3606 domain-containing protein [Mucilaginibacter flavus]MDN3582086.1 DUF3606 domain-containing protein [Mucilaginibacter flavus]
MVLLITPDQESAQKNHNLRLILDDTYAFALEIQIFTKRKKLVEGLEMQSGELRSYSLPEGEYIVRLILNGMIADNQVALYEDKSFGVGKFEIGEKLNAPELYSSAPIGGNLSYGTSFDYYTQPAVAISKLETYKNNRLKHKTSGLFIFLRFPNADYFTETSKEKPNWNNFSLTNEAGKILAQFPEGWKGDGDPTGYNIRPYSGYIAFSGYLAPGLYFLNYGGSDARVIPVSVYNDWYTQVFLTMAEQPLFGTLRIFLSKRRAFDPNDKNHLYIDYCLNKIQNGDFTLDEQLIQRIAYNKFDSPMLGLLGAYIYLFSKETEDDGLFDIIVRNLQTKIIKNSKTSPDIWALNLLSYQHFKKTVALDRQTTIKGTPMLRIAYDSIKEAAVIYPWLVPENSLNDHIAEYQCFDSPFNTYKPFQTFWVSELLDPSSIQIPNFGKKPAASKKRTLLESSNSIKMSINGLDVEVHFNDSESNKLFNTSFEPTNPRALKSSLDRQRNRHFISSMDYEPIKFFGGNEGRYQLFNAALNDDTGSPLSSYIASALLENSDLKPKDIAESLNLPLNTVLRIFKELHIDTSKVDAQEELKSINPEAKYEVDYWADRLNVSADEIVNAIKVVGQSSLNVEGYLKDQTS